MESIATETRESMTAQYLPVVRRLCQRYRQSGVPLEDLVQVGSIGLLKAIDKFDPQRGTAFLSFAIPVILGEVRNYFRDHGWAVKVPRKLQRQRMMVAKAVESLSQARGCSPTISEIAEATGLETEVVNDTLELGRFGYQVSLEAQRDWNGRGDAPSLTELLGEEDADIDSLPERLDLAAMLHCLPARERTIIELKFFAGLPQVEIARRLGMSQMHVSRLQRQALGKLKLGMV